jgi:hypothetical protein
MSRAADSPSSRIDRVIRGGCAVIHCANGHYLLLDGRVDDDNVGVVWLNKSKAYCEHRLMYPGWVRSVLKKALHNDGEFENERTRQVWPASYRDVSFENVKVGM